MIILEVSVSYAELSCSFFIISVMSSSLVGVSGRFLIGPDRFSMSAYAFLKGVGVRGVSSINRLLAALVGVTTPPRTFSRGFWQGRALGVLRGL